jgi:SAM-dependent methyltransferase
VIGRVRDWLIDPAVRAQDVDGLDCSIAHRQGLQRKAILRLLFERFYRECRSMDLRYFDGVPGRRLEIGSGAGVIKSVLPDVITSDIKQLPFLDIVLRGEAMPFPANSLRAIYAINVFHHIPAPRLFLREMLRVLHPGGGFILIEPFYGPLACWVFRHLHASEGFDPGATAWETAGMVGPMSNANQALSYLVFTRDRARFDEEFPDLEVVVDRPHTHLWYVVSGGLNFRQLLPDGFVPLVRFAERLLAPLNPWLALQHTVVVRKRPGPSSPGKARSHA